MKAPGEDLERILRMVKEWFDGPDLVEHYVDEAQNELSQSEFALLGQFDPPATILDIGCGAGRVTLALAAQGFDVVGVDVSEALLKHARRIAQHKELPVEFIHVDPLSLPFDTSQFDIALMLKVYCYIPTRIARRQYLEEVARVLTTDGAVLLSQYVVPDENFEEYRDGHFEKIAQEFFSLEPGDAFPEGRGYVHWFTERQLIDELQDSPFDVESFESDEQYGGGGLLRFSCLRKKRTRRSKVNA